MLGEVSGKDVEAVLTSFTEQAGYPLLTLQLEGSTLKVAQKRFTNAGVAAPEMTWSVPLVVRYGVGDKVAKQTVLLNDSESEFELKLAPDWIMPDDGGTGYFRWSVPNEMLQTLVKREVLTDREKLATMHNISGLFQAGVLSAGESFELLTAFADDPQPAVSALALGAVKAYGDLFVSEQNSDAWKLFLNSTLTPVRKRYSLQSQKHEGVRVPSLRNELIYLLGNELQDETVLDTAHHVAVHYLKGEPVDPATVDTYLALAVLHGDRPTVAEVTEALVSAKDPQRRSSLLAALGLFGSAQAQNEALDVMLTDAVTPSDLRTLLTLNGQHGEARRERLLTWIENNYAELSQKLPAAFVAVIPQSLSGVTDLAQLDRILAFFREQPDPNGAVERALVKLEETVKNKVATRKRGQDSFDRLLQAE